MTYATRANLEQAYGVDEVAQRESALAPGALDAALAVAEATINGYLTGRYSLPLSSIPPNLPQIASALARYTLLGEAATERARNDYKDAMGWLKDVAAGSVVLQSATPEPANAPSAMVILATSPAVFKRSARS